MVSSSVTHRDVLCGRGGKVNKHPGNLRFRTIVERTQMPYLTAKKSEKKEIGADIVRQVKSQGGRFMRRSSKRSSISAGRRSSWVEMKTDCAVFKACQALRDSLGSSRNDKRKMCETLLQCSKSSTELPDAKKRRTSGYGLALCPKQVIESVRSDGGLSEIPVVGIEQEDPLFHIQPIEVRSLDDKVESSFASSQNNHWESENWNVASDTLLSLEDEECFLEAFEEVCSNLNNEVCSEDADWICDFVPFPVDNGVEDLQSNQVDFEDLNLSPLDFVTDDDGSLGSISCEEVLSLIE